MLDRADHGSCCDGTVRSDNRAPTLSRVESVAREDMMTEDLAAKHLKGS